MIWATDNGTSDDSFPIKTWAENDGIEDVVHDNGVQQMIGGGQIVVHTKRATNLSTQEGVVGRTACRHSRRRNTAGHDRH